MKYYINEIGDIVAQERESNQLARPVPVGQTVVVSEATFDNPSDWRWNGSDFELRLLVPYTVADTVITTEQTTLMTFPDHTIVDIFGPGVSERIVVEELEFGSDRPGTYRFTLTSKPSRKTVVEVIVV